jgi:hypothetical protein
MLMNVGYILDACDEFGKYYFAQVIAVNRARDEITVTYWNTRVFRFSHSLTLFGFIRRFISTDGPLGMMKRLLLHPAACIRTFLSFRTCSFDSTNFSSFVFLFWFLLLQFYEPCQS